MTPEEIKKALEKQFHLLSEQSQRIYVTPEQLAVLSEAMCQVATAIDNIYFQLEYSNEKTDRIKN